MSDFNFAPLNGLQAKNKPRKLESSFGDGYSQRTADGINTNPKVWDVSFYFDSQATMDLIDDFFETRGGVTSFTWTPPGKPEGTFICSEWDRSYREKTRTIISAVFLQVFE